LHAAYHFVFLLAHLILANSSFSRTMNMSASDVRRLKELEDKIPRLKRDDISNMNAYRTLVKIRKNTENWMQEYIEVRPNDSLNYLVSGEY